MTCTGRDILLRGLLVALAIVFFILFDTIHFLVGYLFREKLSSL